MSTHIPEDPAVYAMYYKIEMSERVEGAKLAGKKPCVALMSRSAAESQRGLIKYYNPYSESTQFLALADAFGMRSGALTVLNLFRAASRSG